MATKTRSQAQLEQDRALIAEYYLRGWTQRAISEKLGLTRKMVAYDLAKIQDDWRQSAKYDMSLAMQRQLERIDLVEREAWAAWEGSKAPREKTRTRSARVAVSPDANAAPTSTTSSAEKSSEQRDPDPRYLIVVEWCIDARAKLLGQYAPIGVHHSGSVQTQQVTEFVYEIPAQAPVAGLTIIGRDALPAPVEPMLDDDLDESVPTEFEQIPG